MGNIKAAQRDTKVDEKLIAEGPSLGDIDHNEKVEDKSQVFGVPNPEEEDPFGYLALEREGIRIVEAGTNKRPTSEQFEFRPSPTSPVWTTFNRGSIDGRTTISRRSSWRTSTLSVERTPMVDMAVQTDPEPPQSPRHSPANSHTVMDSIAEDKSTENPPKPKSDIPTVTLTNGTRAEEEPEDDDKDEPEDEPVIIHTVQQAA